MYVPSPLYSHPHPRDHLNAKTRSADPVSKPNSSNRGPKTKKKFVVMSVDQSKAASLHEPYINASGTREDDKTKFSEILAAVVLYQVERRKKGFGRKKELFVPGFCLCGV
nr:hypothetical protein [Tanacetum cinerariifolium]